MTRALIQESQRARRDVLTRQEGRALLIAKPKRNKFGAERTIIDGQAFDSKGEGARFQALKLRQRLGEIADLQAQVPFPLQAPNGEVIGIYKADASYFDCAARQQVVEDFKAKPTRTALFRWKAKHFKAQYGFEITIVESPNA
jgi:hypothetical protein